MGLLSPARPTFDPAVWPTLPFAERIKLACQDWAVTGFGAPATTYVFYLVKLAVYVGAWAFFVSRTPGLGGVADVGSWWSETIAFQKAIIWTLVFESLGLGCASGPLTARYLPPISAFLHFGRPGTTRLPPWPGRVPFTAGHRRTWVDAGLYVLHLAVVLRALLAAELGTSQLVPIVVVLGVLGLRDKTVVLASRAEHYLTTIVVFLFAGDLIAGSKVVQVAIWWWAATSKLNLHFPAVVAVMLSNHPLLGLRRFRRALYRGHPDDLRPSRLPFLLAHGGTVVEYTFPVLLLLGTGGTLTRVGLIAMLAFHLYILTSVPVAVPLEWNVLVMYAGVFLFGAHADVRAWDLDSPLLVGFLLAAVVAVPLYGNLVPARVSFLPSMRYYAGNWGFSWWLFRREALDRLDGRVVTVSGDVATQLRRIFDADTATTLMARGMAFRAMHLHGRVLADLVYAAVDDVEAYEVRDGEMVAGRVLGWNFGDGHLHHEQLLAAVQDQCGFAAGELRCIFVESQPLGTPAVHWRIVDAATGQLGEGHADVRELIERQPWPEATPVRD